MVALLTPVHRDIAGVLSAALTAAGAVFYDGHTPDGEDVPLIPGVQGLVKPHAVLQMGDDDEWPGRAVMSLEGARTALGQLDFIVLCVAPDSDSCTQLRDVVKPALVGHEVPGGGEIRMGGGTDTQPVRTLVKPQRFFRPLGFYCTVGA